MTFNLKIVRLIIMNILKKLYLTDNYKTPWHWRESGKLNKIQEIKINRIALSPSTRIYNPKFIAKKNNNNYLKIVIDLDDTLVLPNKTEQKIYIRNYLVGALEEIKKNNKVKFILWSASSKSSAMDKFQRFPQLISLFDEMIFGENYSIDKPLNSAQTIQKEIEQLENEVQKLEAHISKKDLDRAQTLKKAIEFRKKFPEEKNLQLLGYDLLIDNSLSEKKPSEWIGFNFIRIPTYDMGIINEKNEIDFISLEQFIAKLPNLINRLINTKQSKKQEYINNFQEKIDKLFAYCIDDERHEYLSQINGVLQTESLLPLPIYRSIVQNNDFITFSAICSNKDNSTPQKWTFFKARARLKKSQDNPSNKNYRSFVKEVELIKQKCEEKTFLPTFIKDGTTKNVKFYYYHYIDLPTLGDTYIFNPKSKPQKGLENLLTEKILKIQKMPVSDQILKNLKKMGPKETDQFWTDQNNSFFDQITDYIDTAKFKKAKQYIDQASVSLKPSDFVLAHGDLHPANILYDKEKIYIIDWEMLQKNNFAFDFTMLWIRAWNYPRFQEMFYKAFKLNFGQNFDDIFYQNVLILIPNEIKYWSTITEQPWRHHYKVADQALNQHLKAFDKALTHFSTKY